MLEKLQAYSQVNPVDEITDFLARVETKAQKMLDEANVLVLTDEEANKEVEEHIDNTLWAFNVDFLTEYLAPEIQPFAKDILLPLQKKCEVGNDAIKALVNWEKNKDQIIAAAIFLDGRGHFLASYDGKELTTTVNNKKYYIYKC